MIRIVGGKRRWLTRMRDVPGIRRRFSRFAPVGSRSDAIRCLRSFGRVATASDNGALMAYRDDAGLLRCQFHRYRQTVASLETNSVAEVARWLKVWWPRMERE